MSVRDGRWEHCKVTAARGSTTESEIARGLVCLLVGVIHKCFVQSTCATAGRG